MRSPLPAEVLAQARIQYGLLTRAQLDAAGVSTRRRTYLFEGRFLGPGAQGRVPTRESRRGVRTDMPRRVSRVSRACRQRTVSRQAHSAAAHADRIGACPRERTSRSALRRRRSPHDGARDGRVDDSHGRHSAASSGATRRRPGAISRRPRPRVGDRADDRPRPRLHPRAVRVRATARGPGPRWLASLREGSRRSSCLEQAEGFRPRGPPVPSTLRARRRARDAGLDRSRWRPSLHLDGADRGRRFGVEVDHVTWHGGRLAAQRDKWRDRQLMRIDWVVARVTDEDLQQRFRDRRRLARSTVATWSRSTVLRRARCSRAVRR